MFTFSELRELVLAGEFVAVLRLLLAHRLVFTEDTQGDVTANLTPFSIQMVVAQPGCDRHITITLNSDGSPAVDVFPEEDLFYVNDDYPFELIDEPDANGKDGQPPMDEWQPTFISLAERICQILRRDGLTIQEVDINNWSPDAHCSIVTSEGCVSFEYAEERSAMEIVEEAYEQWEQEAEFEEAMQEYDAEFLAVEGPQAYSLPEPSRPMSAPITYSEDDPQDIPF